MDERPESVPPPQPAPQQPQQPPTPPQYPYYPSYAPPPPAPGTGTGGRAVLWATAGAVLASVVWAGGIYVLGGDPDADLRGYRSKANLCSAVDYSSLKREYPAEDGSPSHNSLEHTALDQSYCSISLKKTATSSYSDAYFSVQVDLHKTTDPAPEFTALWSEYDQRYEDYEVEEIAGFGDEAYLVTEDTTTGSSSSGSRAVTLAVRDGWMTYQMSWSVYSTSYDTEDVPEVTEVSRWLKADTESTLENLKSS